MDFNTFLLRFGINPDNFEAIEASPIPFEHGFIYELVQRNDLRTCPFCNTDDTYINDYRIVTINCSQNKEIKDVLRIKKIRFKCKQCKKTFTLPLRGIERRKSISLQTKQLIISSFTKMITFQQIGEEFGLSKARILQIFDEMVKYVPRRVLPKIMCIDEIRFKEFLDQNFACVLYDFEKSEVVDIIGNRQKPYLNRYFNEFKKQELDNVEVFVSDMYDTYASIYRKYFFKAIHIIDLFHVINQLTTAVNKIRSKVMNEGVIKGTLEYTFMKSKWRLFICNRKKISDSMHIHKQTLEKAHYGDMIIRCLHKSNTLWEGYSILQELLNYSRYDTFDEALSFILRISKKLIESSSPLLNAVGRTYHKWRIEIANGLSKNKYNIHYSNSVAEGLNNKLKTVIKIAYGYHNFERFRNRALLILTYSK